MMKHWMFTCSEVSRLVSESMDHELPLWQRMGMKFHLMMCGHCSRHKHQLHALREMMHNTSHFLEEGVKLDVLPEEARLRIKQALKDSEPTATQG